MRAYAFLGPIYTERQDQCCNVTSDIALIKLLRFLNKPSESLQKLVATPIDQIWQEALILTLQINHWRLV